MKTIRLLVLCLCLALLCGCQSPATTSEPTSTTEPTTQEAVITLGMTPEQLLEQLNTMGLQLEMPNYDENPFPEEVENPIRDGRLYNMTDLSFTYHTKDWAQIFTFSFEGKLVRYSSRDTALATAEGLAAGDTVKQMENLYGTDYQKDVEDYTVYQYNLENGYLTVFYEGTNITSWMISTYPNINND